VSAPLRNGPPAKADPSELWIRLSELPRPTSARYKFRARNEEVGDIVFRVLTADELSHVRVRAQKEAEAQLGEGAKIGSLAYEEEYEQQKAYQLLALACRQPDDVQFPTWMRPQDVRLALTDDEIAVALLAYAQFRRTSGPVISELTPEEMEAWIKLLQEGAGRFPLARCSGEVLIDLIMYLVSKQAPSATATSSAGSPPGEHSTPQPDVADEGASPA
jgi:hypothetical protein